MVSKGEQCKISRCDFVLIVFVSSTQVKSLQEENVKCQQQISELEKKLSDARKGLSSRDALIKSLEENVTDMEKRIEKLEVCVCVCVFVCVCVCVCLMCKAVMMWSCLFLVCLNCTIMNDEFCLKWAQIKCIDFDFCLVGKEQKTQGANE